MVAVGSLIPTGRAKLTNDRIGWLLVGNLQETNSSDAHLL